MYCPPRMTTMIASNVKQTHQLFLKVRRVQSLRAVLVARVDLRDPRVLANPAAPVLPVTLGFLEVRSPLAIPLVPVTKTSDNSRLAERMHKTFFWDKFHRECSIKHFLLL